MKNKLSKASIIRRKLVCGVGINDADYEVRPRINGVLIPCPYYEKWHGMLHRCYNKKLHKKYPSYINTTVCDEWLLFSNFKKWMEKQDWKNKELDKDILTYDLNTKLYSPETCLFVSKEINTLLNDRRVKRGQCPQGVSWKKDNKKYSSYLGRHGKRCYLGLFNNPLEAYKVYIKEKISYITEIALKQEDKLKNALLNVALAIELNYKKGIVL